MHSANANSANANSATTISVRTNPAAVGVLGTGTYLPAQVRTNEQIAPGVHVSPQWIAERTGIVERHVAADDEASSDLGAAAVRAACDAAGIELDELDLLVAATSTPDELGPATACRIQAQVGARGATALDVTAACSGWLFAAKIAHDWLRVTPGARHAAVVGVETYSKFLDPHGRGTAVLFGDGAAAAVLGPVAAGAGFASFDLGSDGRGAHHVGIRSGGSREPASADTLAAGGHLIHMDGRVVRDFIAELFPRLVESALARHRLDLLDIDAFICHQPNPVLLRDLGDRIGIPADRLLIVGDRTGDIGAASAPFALADAARRGALRDGSRVLVCVFGAGLTWGSTLIGWTGASALTAPVRTNPVPVLAVGAHA